MTEKKTTLNKFYYIYQVTTFDICLKISPHGGRVEHSSNQSQSVSCIEMSHEYRMDD